MLKITQKTSSILIGLLVSAIALFFVNIVTFNNFDHASAKTDYKAWDIPRLDMENILANTSSEYKYTVFNTENVAYRNKENIAELYYATGKNLSGLIALKPQRILLHEIIVQAVTKYRWQDAEILRSHVRQVYYDLMHTSSTQKLLGELDRYWQTSNKNMEIINKNNENYKIINKSYSPGKYVKNYTIKNVLLDLSQDQQYQQYADKKIFKLVSSYYDNFFRTQPDLAIHTNKQIRPYTVMLAGGPASGKSSYDQIIKLKYKQNGVNWQDVVKVNTDNFKILLKPYNTRSEQVFFSQLVTPEAEILSDYRLKERIGNLIKQGQIKHVLWDQVLIDPTRVTWGLYNNGIVAINIIYSDTDKAVQRAFERGKASGRYEPTQLILDFHKKVATDLPSMITQFSGKNVFINLIDNNGSKFSTPNILEVFNSSKYVIIHDPNKLQGFINKLEINNHARSISELWNGNETDTSVYLSPLVKAGYRLELKN